MDADREAPVFAEGRIEVAAPPDVLWDIMADFESWPTWNTEVDTVVLEGLVQEGTVFRWKAGATRLVSVLRRVERPHEIGWTGRAMGVRAIHIWHFRPGPEGSIATMEESFDGLLARLFRKQFQRRLDRSTEHGLRALKTAAEGTNPAAGRQASGH